MSHKSDSEYSRWKTATDYPWPESENLKFWSWAPYSATEVAGKLSDAEVSEGVLTFSYECPSTGAEGGKVAEAQSDVLLAYADHQSTDKSSVELLYKHALSAVCFKVDRANKCTVKSVSLSNVYNKGICSFDGSTISWVCDSEETKTFTETFNKEIAEYLKDDYGKPQSLSTARVDADKTFLFIPQSATDDKKITLTLVLTLSGSDEEITLSAELDPSDCDWEPGWMYTYSAEFDKSDYEFHLDISGGVSMDYRGIEGTNTHEF